MRSVTTTRCITWKSLSVVIGHWWGFAAMLLIFLISIATAFASPVSDSLLMEFKQARRDDQILSLVKSWLPRMVDERDYHRIQGWWGIVDRPGRDKWFKDRHLADPDNPMFYYLWLRTLNKMDEVLDGAEAIIHAHPDYYWGYRLLSAEFSSLLDINRSSYSGRAARQRLEDKEAVYVELLLQGEEIFGADPYILSSLGDHYEWHGKWTQLEATALKIVQSSEPFEASGFIYQLCRVLESADPARRLLPLYVSSMLRRNDLPAEDSLKVYNARMMEALYYAEDWPALDSLLTCDPGLVDNRNYRYVILPTLINMGRIPEAVALARDYVIGGYDIDSLLDYSMIDAYFDDPLWDEFEDKIPEYEELSRQREIDEYNQKRLRRELPRLDIRDTSGEPLHLSDYLGKTIKVFFWASWGDSFGQLKEYLQESAKDSTMTVSLLVNGYDSDPIRAQASQMEFASEMPYYHIDDAGLETLGIKYMPGVMVIGPDGLLDFIDDASDFYFWDLGYPFK